MASLSAGVFVVLALAVVETWSCSLPPNTPFYSPTERAILAPIVIQARVLNTSATPGLPNEKYQACVRLVRIFKVKNGKDVPREFCFGEFGPDHLCLIDVYQGGEYVFFLDEDMTAKYDGFPQAALIATKSTLLSANRGYCRPRPGCDLPRIDQRKFKSLIRISEGGDSVLSCPSYGTTPYVVLWSKRGSYLNAFSTLHPQREGKMYIQIAGESDSGTYTCKVLSPAGETTAAVRVVVSPKPCGDIVVLRRNGNSTITSPNFPRYYPRDKKCTWRLCPAPRQRLELEFKTFALRRRDRLEIHNECDSYGTGALSYCWSTSPGTMVSQCPSGCVIIGFSAQTSMIPNNEAKGFELTVTSTDKDSTPFSYKNLYCENDLLIRFEPTVIQVSEMKGKVVFNFKKGRPQVGEEITLYDAYPLRDLYGCSVRMRYGMHYYIGASIKGGRARLRFALLTVGSAVPVNFEYNLKKYRDRKPSC